MRTLHCPHCESDHLFLLSPNTDTHLRRCPDWKSWFLVHEQPDGDRHEYDLKPLDDPPTCPVGECDETLSSDELPKHIVSEHEGNLSSES